MQRITLQEQAWISAWAAAGWSDRRIAAQLGCSRHTVRKWRRRGARPRSARRPPGRPAHGPLSSFAPLVQQSVQGWAQAHPGWGPGTLRAELEQAAELQGLRLPARATLARWLHQRGRTRPYERHRALPAIPAPPVQAPHEEWELDARGHERVAGVGVVSLINLNDSCGHLKLLSYPAVLGTTRLTRKLQTEDYQLALRLTFSEWGLPARLSLDHESVFFDNRQASPFPTRLHLWLLALGVQVRLIGVHRPIEHGQTERSHQTWDRQVLQDGTVRPFAGQTGLWQALQHRRAFLNAHLPCAALGGQPPLSAYPQARQSGRPYRPEWERELLDVTRLYPYLAQGEWFRRASRWGEVQLGRQRYHLGQAWGQRDVRITFDAERAAFRFQAPQGELAQTLPPLGLTPDVLMGAYGALAGLDQFQLALPFTPAELGVIRIYETFALRIE